MSTFESLLDVLMSECAHTEEVAPAQDCFGELVCCEHSGCFETFFSNTGYDNVPKKGPERHYCSKKCKGRARDAKEMSDRLQNRELKEKVVNIAYAYLNRDRYLSVIDGRYEGPLNKCVTLVMTVRKDHGYHPMPIDVHVNPIEKKFGQVTPDDHDWAERQKPFQHTQPMPRLLKTFCTHCVDLVIDGASAEVRATRGVYLPIEHECARVRVYDLRGKLLEVKAL